MKLFAATLTSSAFAQFANFGPPDAVSTFTIPETGLDTSFDAGFDAPDANPVADLGPVTGDDLLGAFETFGAEEDDAERYGVFTTPTSTPPDDDKFDYGFDCWKCDQMTFADCAMNGEWKSCPTGDYDVCFLELRSTHNNVQQICTGCKDLNACSNLKFENFRDANTPTPWDQCRPTVAQQNARGRFGNSRQSVCRQCFNTCDHDSTHHDPKLWCPTYHTSEGTNFLMSSASGTSPADLAYPDQESFQIPQWDRLNHWKLGDAPSHGAHQQDVTFWRVDLVAHQLTELNDDILAGLVHKSDFDDDIVYDDDQGTINQNNSG